MIKKQGIIVLAGALAAAFLAANLISGLLVKKPPEKRMVVAAKASIAKGDALTTEKLKLIAYASKSIPKGLFSKISNLEGRVAAEAFQENELIHERRLKPLVEEVTKAPEDGIGPGMCVVRIEISKQMALSGLLAPGDRVDVIASGALDKDKGQQISRVILSGVRIRDIGPSGPDPEDAEKDRFQSRKRNSKESVALVLTRKEALILSAAENQDLSLVRRSRQDDETTPGDAVIYSAELGARTREELNRMAEGINERFQSQIKPGQRAITIRVNDEDGICGFLRPGQRVDLVATHNFIQASIHGVQKAGTNATVTGEFNLSKIVMQNLEILFVEEDTTLAGKPVPLYEEETDTPETSREFQGATDHTADQWSKTWSTRRVTVVVSPEQAEQLAVISETSNAVKLILRKNDDNRVVKTSGEKSTEIFHKEEALYHNITVLNRGQEKTSKRFRKEDLERQKPHKR